MKTATTAEYKTLSDLALIFGVISHLEDKYNGKSVKESIARVKKESNKFMNMIEGGVDKKQIKKLESRIMFLNNYLNHKDVSVFTSTALALVDDLKKYMKDKKLKQCQILETRLMSLHKKVDTKFDKLIFDNYIDADRTVTAWREY